MPSAVSRLRSQLLQNGAVVEAMVAHHQGAVDMAKVILAFGQNPEIRKLAEEVIKAQEAEITFLLHMRPHGV